MILTNLNGGQVKASGDTAEALKRNGWTEVVSNDEATPSPEATPKKSASTRTRRTTKK